jgi:hypothetical protein
LRTQLLRRLAIAGLMLGFAVAPTPAHATAAPAPQSSAAPECPPVLMSKCSFDPALYANHDPADPTNYGNYDIANRPADGNKILGTTVHDIEGTCEDAVDWFKNPSSFVSAHYVICADGRVIQMVKLKDVAWTAGNWWYNMHFIQLEVAGFASQPSSYTAAARNSAAILTKWHSQKFQFPINRATVHGHDNVPGTRDNNVPTQHVDPGPFWNWQNFMGMLSAPVVPKGNMLTSKMVTIAPLWPLSRETVTGCSISNDVPPPCVPAGSHNTNFVYLRSAPDANAPLITDVLTGQGSTDIENRSARAFYGNTFVVADRKVTKTGIWFKIWFSGQGAWFYSPYSAPTAFAAKGSCAKPKGTDAVPVYGRPLPELSEWPADFTPPAGSQPAPTTLSYTVAAGQCYTVINADITPDHYFSWSFGNELPRFRVVGDTKYVWIYYNGRQGFVKKSAVTIS